MDAAECCLKAHSDTDLCYKLREFCRPHLDIVRNTGKVSIHLYKIRLVVRALLEDNTEDVEGLHSYLQATRRK